MAAIIRLKRKACEEPAEGLVIALKKPKCDLSDANEVLFKFAATLSSEKDSVRDHIQAALYKEKADKFSSWRNPKDSAISENKVKKVREKLLAEHKSASEKKKLDFLNNRRLILTEEFQDLEDTFSKDAEVRQLFHLYDIIEENEDIKKQNEEFESTITCNDQPLIREKKSDYVFDVYIADGHIDQTFVKETVSVRPCTLTDDIYFGESDDSEECFEDEDDSNDENNWRNDYPDEKNSDKDKDSESESYSDDGDVAPYYKDIAEAFNEFDIDEDINAAEHESDYGHAYERRVLKELREDYDECDQDYEVDEDYRDYEKEED